MPPGQRPLGPENLGKMTDALAAQAAPATLAPVLERLLAEHRYVEALELLRAADRERPGSKVIRDGIALLERRVGRGDEVDLGDRARVPRLAVGEQALAKLGPTDLGVAVRIDGAATIEELLGRAGADRRDLARRLARLIDRGVITFGDENTRPLPVPQPDPTRPMHLRPVRPGDCDRTALIELVPDATALVARARRRRRVRARGQGWLLAAATIAVGVASVAAAARYHEAIWSALSALLVQ